MMNNISENLKIHNIENCENVNLQDYKYAFITMMSEVILKPVSEIKKIDWDEVLDMRVFDDKKEAHMWKNDALHGVIVEEIAETDHIDQMVIIMKNISDKKLKVRKYISYDEDGQAYVALTRMVELI